MPHLDTENAGGVGLNGVAGRETNLKVILTTVAGGD